MSRASQAGRDYEPLRAALAEGDFEKADDITREELIQLAGPGAVKRSWVYFSGAQRTPAAFLADCTASEFGYELQTEKPHGAGSLRATLYAACSLRRYLLMAWSLQIAHHSPAVYFATPFSFVTSAVP